MPSIEMKIISRILDTKKLDTVLLYGIREEYFSNPLAHEIFKYITEHKEKHGVVPSIEQVALKFKEYCYEPSDDSLEGLCESLKDFVLSKKVNKKLEYVLKVVDKDPKSALEYLRHTSSLLSKEWKQSPRDISLNSYVDAFYEEYKKVKELGGVVGIPFPWPKLNEETRGIFPQQLIVIYGSAKSMKTFLLLYMATELYIQHKKKVLVITKEMSPEAIAKRSLALVARLPYREYRKGSLTSHQEEEMLKRFSLVNGAGFYKISDGRSESGDVSVNSIRDKIEQFEPDIVFVDGVYLLADARTNQRVADYKNITHITQDLKDLAQQANIPIIISSQANRYGDARSTDALAYSYSFTQDADLLMRIYLSRKDREIAIVVQAIREGEEVGFVINAIPTVDFSQKLDHIPSLDKFIRESKKKDAGEVPNTELSLNMGGEQLLAGTDKLTI